MRILLKFWGLKVIKIGKLELYWVKVKNVNGWIVWCLNLLKFGVIKVWVNWWVWFGWKLKKIILFLGFIVFGVILIGSINLFVIFLV